MMAMRLVRPAVLVDIHRLPALQQRHTDAQHVRTGAAVRQRELEDDAELLAALPLLRAALAWVGHTQTRNRGTVGGSVAHADGSAEIPLCLSALGGTIVVEGPGGRREIEPDAFFVTHFLTTLGPGELVVETDWPQPQEYEGAAFEEFALRAGDYALSMVAVVLRRVDGVAEDVRIRVGAVTDRPTGFADVEAAVQGSFVSPAVAREAGALAAAAVDPAGTIHATPEYLRALTGTLVERALLRAWERAA